MRTMIAIATYQRPDDIARCLAATLPQVRAMDADPSNGVDASILVIDNDASGSARESVTAFESALVAYVIEERPGISAARNRALAESAGYDLLIYIDDDEEPQLNWLAQLVGCYLTSGAQAVAGKVISDLDGLDDQWILEGGYFERRPRRTGQEMSAAATNNLLLDLGHVARYRLKFDDRYGLSGGGDTHFTRRFVAAGGKIVWCEEAVVVDHVPTTRMTREWVRKRARRMGNSDVVVDLDIAPSGATRRYRRVRGLARGVARILAGGLMVLTGFVTRSVRRNARGVRLIERGRGMAGGAVGSKEWEYSRPARVA